MIKHQLKREQVKRNDQHSTSDLSKTIHIKNQSIDAEDGYHISQNHKKKRLYKQAKTDAQSNHILGTTSVNKIKQMSQI